MFIKSLSCASALWHFSGPTAVGLLSSGGDSVLSVISCTFMLVSRHLSLGGADVLSCLSLMDVLFLVFYRPLWYLEGCGGYVLPDRDPVRCMHCGF